MKKWLYNILLAFFALVFVGSSVMLAYYIIDGSAQDAAYNALSQMREEAIKDPTAIPNQTPTTDDSPWVTVTDPDTGKSVQLLPEFFQLYGLNHDLVGWITVPGTKIDYPVLQKPEKEDYYLRRDYYGKKASAGSIYVKESCDVFTPSDNVTIYGHMMRNGTMFADLKLYKEKDFWQEHKTVLLSNLREHHEYEIFAVFITTASVGKGFAYHDFDFAADQAEFDEFVAQCRDLALYDTGIVPQYGEKLITLSTCDYGLTNGRLVVVARRTD